MQALKPTRERARYRAYLAVTDAVLGLVAVAVSLSVVPPGRDLRDPAPPGVWIYALLIPCWLVSMALHGQYEFHPRWLGLPSLYRNGRAVLVGTLACIAVAYFLSRGLAASRGFYAVATVVAAVLFTADRALAAKLFPDRVLRERYLLLGMPKTGLELTAALANGHLPPHVQMVGCLVSEVEAAQTEKADGLPVLGTFADFNEVVAAYEITRVALCPGALHSDALVRAAARAEALGLPVERLETTYETLTGRAPILLAGADWAESLESVRAHPYMTRYKRIVDVVISLLLLPLALGIIGLAAAAMKVLMPGPVFYSQKRVGKDGEEFVFTKLRTMVEDAEKDTGAVWATENDPRVTPLGRLLRKLRLDELPQLFSVLRGHMSLVGPRPERPEFVSQFIEQIPFYEKRLLVRPGITGWAQVNHGYDRSLEDVLEKLRYDLYYIRHLSFTLDLQILLRTIWVMLGRKGAI